MKRIKPAQHAVVYLSVLALLGGCAASQPGGPGRPQSSAATEDPCGVGTGALVGAAAGAMLGAILGGTKGALAGAALGGATGAVACLAINVQSRQTKTAAQADVDYRKTRGTAPREPMVVSYSPQLSSQVVKRGQPVKVSSSVELVNGTNKPVQEVREELQVYAPDGNPIRASTKPFTANSAGRFENSFELKLPDSAPQGTYAMKTNLYVNGKLNTTRDLNTQLVWDGNTGVLVASR
ncbi:hypothetical protein AB4156_02155 [Cupriavidus sp. 2MCAB6]|uniref:hypothetical protein n=1 Tax=Cupriavidus sp. 2MCAB6 TaxID=3232981 RepID=UPI003F93DBD3